MDLRKDFLDTIEINKKFNDALVGCQKRKSNDTLRIISYNVHSWKNIQHTNTEVENLELFRAIDADVICLQEVVNDEKFISQVTAIFPNTYFCPTMTRYDGGFGNMILSKHPIISKSFQCISSDTFEKRCVMKITIDPGENCNLINIYNCHLDVYDATEQTRLKQMEQIYKFMQEQEGEYTKSILCGDFNSIHSKDYSIEKWKDILAQDQERQVKTLEIAQNYIRTQMQLKHCFALKKYWVPLTVWSGRVVDYIFFGKSWSQNEIIEASLFFTDISDHLPVIADITLRVQDG
jgi:endonuclease/exonuclease/phosphatase family metal-dependent hydrolase